MKKNRQLPGPGPSFFAFQAVIMGLIGVMILIALFFAAFGNTSSQTQGESLETLQRKLDNARAEKDLADQMLAEQTALEQERQRLVQMMVKTDPKATEQAYKQRLEEIDAASQTKNEIQQAVALAQAKFEQMRQEKGSVRLAYRPLHGDRIPIIAVLAGASVQVVTAPDSGWGTLTRDLFQAKLSKATRDKVHVVLYARPSSIELLEELRGFLKKQDFTFGYQAVGEYERLSFLPQ